MRTVYLDHAATTPVHPDVVAAMAPYWSDTAGNASSMHEPGRIARHAVDDARDTIARVFGATPSEVVFTSGGTEGINAAIKGVAIAAMARGRHLVTTAIEHHAVLHACDWLANLGFETTIVPVDRNGMVDPNDVRRAIRPDTVLVSVMFANNEIGTIQPIAEVATVTRHVGVPLHVDAVQAAGTLPIDVHALGIDLMTISAHKFQGPKGVGVLTIRNGTPWLPMQSGGAQEGHRRAGTENVPGIVGLAAALRLSVAHRDEANLHLSRLRDLAIERILATVPHARLTGHPTHRLANNASFAFQGIEGESILLSLDMAGIAASSGSACTSGATEPSHVVAALGLPDDWVRGTLRLSFGATNDLGDVEAVAAVLPAAVARLRALAPRRRDAASTASPITGAVEGYPATVKPAHG
jgi:cysteine desulfurase